MAVPVTRRRRAGRRKMTGRMAAVKEKYTGDGPKAHGLRRRGRSPGSGTTARSPRARGGSAVVPPTQVKRLTGFKARAGSATGAKSLDAMRAAVKSRKPSTPTSGGSPTPGTGPTPATTPRPKIGARGKSALAASRTGRPPAHGARRRGKTPGAVAPRLDRGGGGGPVPGSTPVGSIQSSPKLAGVKKRISSVGAMPKVKARKRGRGSY